MTEPIAYLLSQNEIPTHWYNLVADLPAPPPPPLNPATGQAFDDPTPLMRIFPQALIMQEVSTERMPTLRAGMHRLYGACQL
ncbi:MAG: hypothetical protein C4336_09825 [Armatimonadota bacterium]